LNLKGLKNGYYVPNEKSTTIMSETSTSATLTGIGYYEQYLYINNFLAGIDYYDHNHCAIMAGIGPRKRKKEKKEKRLSLFVKTESWNIREMLALQPPPNSHTTLTHMCVGPTCMGPTHM
jgi:hypothetical protein